jgi:catechol 2,3-dioxygenase-like lactoylglutathione lyase family enzyme
MINKISHMSLYVLDQDKAYEFYVNKLGFAVHTDAKMDNGFRWLTVTPPEQPELEITILAPLLEGAMGFDEETRNAFRILLDKGAMGAGVLNTSNCRATYDELKAKGVQFRGEPKEQFYGTEVIMTDGLGNWFSVTEPFIPRKDPLPLPEAKAPGLL